MNIKVYELKIKLYTLKDIPVDDMLSIESDYIHRFSTGIE